jgi:hypothetical protein
MTPLAVQQGGAAGALDGRAAMPRLAFLLAAAAILGTAAAHAAWDISAGQPNEDIWQHAAALLALMEAPWNPANPFVATDETSRHFHPLWLAFAAAGRAFDLSAWQLLAAASWLSMAILGLGIHLFARRYFPASPWAPLVLLLTMTAAWGLQPQHTGFHSFHTLLYAAPYPATAMIGAGLILWALTIRALEAPRARAALAPLVLAALMLATHQLGAVIALIGAGCFVLCWPGADLRRRAIVGGSLPLGAGLSLAWPHHNPIGLILTPGNSTWEGGFPFYTPLILLIVLIPAILGVLGLRGARARALALALAIYTILYLSGLAGPQVAGRFLMPMTLVLHIGLADLVLRLIAASRLRLSPGVAVTAVAMLVPGWVAVSLTMFASRADPPPPGDLGYHEAARVLTADIPDTQEVAAHGLLAWPVVGTGQRVLSIPWPEPGIADLAARQAATRDLFDPTLSARARIDRARAAGIRTLLTSAAARDAPAIAALIELGAVVTVAGPYLRVDLHD